MSTPRAWGFLPSVLDHLLDDNPAGRHEPTPRHGHSLQQLTQAVQRDLEHLLNTRQTLLTYGLPDCTAVSLQNPHDRVRIRRILEQAIALGEPRLLRVRVTLESPGQPDQVVRFHAHVSLGFPPSAVHAITPPPDATQPAHMTVAFMGLVGLMGALPRHYPELLLERARQKDATLGDFLDLFHHRLTALFYRAWEKYHFPVAHERAIARPQEEPFAGYLFHLIGLGTPGLRGRQAIDDHILLHYAGLLARRVRSASTLAGLLQDYFRVPVAVTQFVGQWLPLEPEQRSCLGVRTAANTLGATAVAGRRVWDQQASFTVRVGPLTLAEFQRFLPTGSALRPLAHLTRFVAGPACDFTVRLVLQAAEVPRCRLGQRQTSGSQLGYAAWLPRTAHGRDADDAVFPDTLA